MEVSSPQPRDVKAKEQPRRVLHLVLEGHEVRREREAQAYSNGPRTEYPYKQRVRFRTKVHRCSTSPWSLLHRGLQGDL